MKFTILAVLGLSISGSVKARQLETYDADVPYFDIIMDSCVFAPDVSGSDIGDVTCTFTSFGGVSHSVSSAVYADDCESTLALTGISQDDPTEFTHSLVPGSTTQESGTYVATISIANSAAPADSTSINFCLRTEVKDKAGDVYDWIGQKIKLDINLDGTFSTDSLSTITFDGNTEVAEDAGDASFGVGIKRCDANGNEVTDDTELTLGENFFLCVEGDQTTVVINSIREMMAAKDGVTDMNLVTTIGDGSGEGERNPNTFVYGYGSNKVVIATRLPSPFFEAGGAVTLSGTANISIGSSRRRLGRSLQVTSSKKESAGFRMEVGVVSTDDASGASAIKATTALILAAFGALFV